MRVGEASAVNIVLGYLARQGDPLDIVVRALEWLASRAQQPPAHRLGRTGGPSPVAGRLRVRSACEGRWRRRVDRYGGELDQLAHDLRRTRPAVALAADLVRAPDTHV